MPSVGWCPGNQHILLPNGTFEDFPFTKVRYMLVGWRVDGVTHFGCTSLTISSRLVASYLPLSRHELKVDTVPKHSFQSNKPPKFKASNLADLKGTSNFFIKTINFLGGAPWSCWRFPGCFARKSCKFHFPPVTCPHLVIGTHGGGASRGEKWRNFWKSEGFGRWGRLVVKYICF